MDIIYQQKIDGNIVTLSIAIGPSASQGKELAYITFDIPADSKEGDTFVYSVPSGKYVVDTKISCSQMLNKK